MIVTSKVLGAKSQAKELDAWHGFTTVPWCTGIEVREFIQRNYHPYAGTKDFLAS